MPITKLIVIGLPIALGVVMIGNGVITFAGPSLVRRNFAQWGFRAGFNRAVGSLGVVIGLLLMIPATVRHGAIGSVIFMLVAIVTLIRSRDWGHMPAAVVLMAASLVAITIHW